jgi:hypothetical protein
MDDDSFLQPVSFDPGSIDVSNAVGGAGVSTDASGMSVVTVDGSQEGSIVPWVIGIAALLFLLHKSHA